MGYKLNIAATYEISLLENSLQFWKEKFKQIFLTDIGISDFNSVETELLSVNSSFRTNNKGLNFIIYRNCDILTSDLFIESLITYLEASNSLNLILVETPSNEQYEYDECSFDTLLVKYKHKITKVTLGNKENNEIYDKVTEQLACIPYTETFYNSLGTFIFRKFWVNLNSPNFKVFVVDCDETLWKGILNEVSISGIGLNDPRKLFRQKLKQQIASGRLVCLNSANDEKDVREVFKYEDLCLTEEDITAWKVNWKPKFENLRDLSKELNLGLDSFVFLDDDATNIGICREEVPEVLSIHFDANKATMEEFINSLWVLDPLDFTTNEDKSRTILYKANIERNIMFESESNNHFLVFLDKLKIKTRIREMETEDVNRVSQLTQRSNRFNATTIRMTEEEVRKCKSKILVVEVEDRFGSYGLCGCVIVEVHNVRLEVRNFILSCRVLNKGIEIEVLKYLAEKVKGTVEVCYEKSSKNDLVFKALETVRSLVNSETFVFSSEKLKSLSLADYYSVEETRVKVTTRSVDEKNSSFVERNQTLLEVFNTEFSKAKKTDGKDIVSVIEEILGYSITQELEKVPLMKLGMKSVQLVQLVARLKQLFPAIAEEITITLPFNYPTVQDISQFLASKDIDPKPSVISINQGAKSHDIAITSMACKFSGGISNPIEFWDFLCKRRNSRMKIHRWDHSVYPPDCGEEVKYMHSIEDLEFFDNKKFRFSDAEAKLMDPQQRIVLSVAYEALFRSEIGDKTDQSIDRFKGKSIGVFLAWSQHDWPYIINESEQASTYTFSGKTASIGSGRVSFTFGLTGPSINVDTACSSSLVALDMASKAIKDGDCEAALVIGVNLNLHPMTFVQLSRAKQLACDGLSKAFDNSANGFARGEGCGAILLQKSSDLISKPLAIVKAVSMNNDGRSSSLPAPNGKAQVACLRLGLAKAKLKADDIHFVETHGAGTKLGDAIEFESLKTVFKNNESLILGALKTNIGHLEAAAGIAGVIKGVLVLLYKSVPANLHLDTLNDCISTENFEVVFPKAQIPYQGVNVGVSSFGMSGTNAFAVIQESGSISEDIISRLQLKPIEVARKQFQCFPKRTKEIEESTIGVKSSIEKLLIEVGVSDVDFEAKFVDLGLDSLAGIEFSQAMITQYPKLGQDFNATTLVYSLETPNDLMKAISGTVAQQKAEEISKDIAIVFTGQGCQYFGMGKDLYEFNEVFRNTIDEISLYYRDCDSRDLKEVMFNGNDTSLIEDTKYAQICIFAFEVALFKALIADKVFNKDNVILLGHSIGELVACVVAGVYTLEEGVKIVAARGQSMSSCPQNNGVMFAIRVDVNTVTQAINTLQLSDVSVAAVNGPTSTVVSGNKTSVMSIIAQVEKLLGRKVVKTQLKVSHAFHSPLMAASIPQFSKVLVDLKSKQGTMPIISELLSDIVDVSDLDSEYWTMQLLGCVNFYGATRKLLNCGVKEIYEVGPTPKLVNLLKSITRSEGKSSVTVCSVLEKNIAEKQSYNKFLSSRNVVVQTTQMNRPTVRSDIVFPTKRSNFNELYKKLFDEKTLLKRMEDRLFEKLLAKWECREDVTPHLETISLDTESIITTASFTTYVLENSNNLVFVFDGENKYTKCDLLASLDHPELIWKKLREHGSILFRNFQMTSPTDFKEVLSALEKDGFIMRDYLDGISPRSEVLPGVYTSTEYAANLDMAVHNEMSYNPNPPELISFFCETPPKQGTGRTPIASSKQILMNLPQALVTEFKRRGLRYIVNSPSDGCGVGVSWQRMYDTDNRGTVEQICTDLGIKYRWNSDNSLTTFRDAPATRKSASNEDIWFNHAHLFHPTDLPTTAQTSLRKIYGSNIDKYPKYCLFGDDTEIPIEYLEIVRTVQKECQVSFDWQQGDLFLIDNFQLCHGRTSFNRLDLPKRRILASMLFKR